MVSCDWWECVCVCVCVSVSVFGVESVQFREEEEECFLGGFL